MKKYLARNHKFFIGNGADWVPISGISSWSVSYERDVQDVSKFNGNGWTSSLATSRAGNINLEGFYLTDAVTKDRDLGQYLCETAANSLGYNGLRGFKLEAYNEAGSLVGYIQTSGTFTIGAFGAGATSVMRWNASVKMKGIPVGNGIYNIFDQEAYPPPEPDISRSGMWTGVLGMYTYAE